MKLFLKDSDIIYKIRQGDESALDYLYKKNYKMMVNLILKNNGSEDEAKDIYQDALIIFWQKVKSEELVLTSKISTFLYSICQNLWRKELDRKNRYSKEEADVAYSENYDSNEKIKIIHDCLNTLGDACKKILSYYYFDEMTMNDIAEIMGFANADTAKTKKYKCKQELDKLIKTKFSESDFLE
ncbi:MAG: sigma-70 family RNA polymerase sigma factor [Cytophagales bacterium]|nr:sigma-70 family RNA polymerase sigma factor [Cytophagales bacterium]